MVANTMDTLSSVATLAQNQITKEGNEVEMNFAMESASYLRQLGALDESDPAAHHLFGH